MSASLVGSEMCIRDRAGLWWDLATSEPWHALAATRVPLADSCFEAMLAVSYTHLTLPTICSV
eukprot:295211-Alexandrium_andersonii.AAC.1